MQKKVSFIVPVHNAKSYLTSCVDSLLEQGLESGSYEIILVNDGSTDGSEDLCQELSKKYDSIRTISQGNKGVSEARNRGRETACGDYICYVDADDYLIPNGVASLLEYCNGKTDLIRFWCEIVNPSSVSKVDDNGRVTFSGSGKEYLRKYGLETFCWNYLYRKSFLEENNLFFQPGIIGEDFSYMFDVLMSDPHIISVSRRIYKYSISPNSISTNRTQENSRRWVRDLMGTMTKMSTILDSYRETDPILYNSCRYSLDNKTVSLFSRMLSSKYTVREFREALANCRAGGIIPLVVRSNAGVSILSHFPHLYPIASLFFRRVFLPFIYPKIDRIGN